MILIYIYIILASFLQLVICLYIIKYGVKSEEFRRWFRENTIIAGPITVLAVMNIEALNLLSSKFAGIQRLNAPIPKQAKRWIFWLSFIGLFVRDIPRLAIQIAYDSLVASCLVILNSLLTSDDDNGRSDE